jgi:predicted NBD/HSP70 family sugar kinase
MNLDDALRSIGEDPVKPEVDVEAGVDRLRAAVRRLHDDPLEAWRIDHLAKLVARDEKDYRLGYEAMQKQNYDTAERYLRRAAQHGNDEAAYWLALLLERRSIGQRLKGGHGKAKTLAAEARQWRLRAQESGIADALDESPGDGLSQPLGPSRSKEPSHDRGREAGRARKDAAVPVPPVLSQGDGCYAVGIEVLPYRFTIVLTNGDGEIISDNAGDLTDMEASAVVPVLAAAAREIVASTLGDDYPADRVVLGVQLGGPLDTDTGTVHFFSKHPAHPSHKPSEFKWEHFPLGPRLEHESGFHTVVLNDAVAFAELERCFGVGQQTGDFVVMLIREGVGGAVVKDGEHFKGPVEIGNFRWPTDKLVPSDAGDPFGVLELDGGITGITRSASEQAGRAITDIETAAKVASEDGPGRAASAAFLAAGVAIATGISYLVQFAGPSHVVLYAPEAMLRPKRRATRNFLSQVREFKKNVGFEVYRNCDLVLKAINVNDGAHGAALAALSRCLQFDPAGSPISTGAVR